MFLLLSCPCTFSYIFPTLTGFSLRNSTGANVGFAQVPTTKELKQLLADYQYRRWQDTDAKALTAAEAAKAQPATCIIIERVPDDALPAMKQYPELHPPDILPRGNVGTPIHEITALIRECRLPTRLIRQASEGVGEGSLWVSFYRTLGHPASTRFPQREAAVVW